MAEESDLEKTEPASPQRLEKAREQGDVARSRELATFVLLGTAVAGLWLTADSLGATLRGALAQGLHFDRARRSTLPTCWRVPGSWASRRCSRSCRCSA